MPLANPMLAFGAPGLFGKIPASGDFVRARAGEPLAQALARWLEEASEAARRGGTAEGREPVRFLYRAPGGARGLAGVLAGGVDKVGRRFPLAVFAPADGPALASLFPGLPPAGRRFLDAGAALIADAARLAAADLPGRLDTLPAPSAEAVAREQAGAEAAAAAAPAGEVLARLFGDLSSGQHLYGLHCLRTACQSVRGREPTGSGVVLDCPVREDLDRFAWLDLVRRSLGWSQAPSFFWAEGPAQRLLVSLGAPPPALLGALWDPARRDGKIWPLTTPQAAAIGTARKALGPEVARVLDDPGAPLAELLSTLTR